MALHFVKTAVLSSENGIDFGTEVAVESDETRKAKLDAEAASRKPLFQQLADIRDRKQDEFDENRKKIFAPPRSLDEDDVEFFDDLEKTRNRAMEARKASEERALDGFRSARTKGNQLEDVDVTDGDLGLANSNKPAELSSNRFFLPPKETDVSVRIIPTITKKRKIDKSSIKTTELPSNSSTVKLAENTANTSGDASSNKIPCNTQDSIDKQKANTTEITATTSTNSSAKSTDSTGGIKEGKGPGSDELNSKVLESGSSSLSMLGGYDSDDE